jgi:hypothetical protein
MRILREFLRRHKLRSLLKKTKGSWKHGDGLDYQRNLRDQWR